MIIKTTIKPAFLILHRKNLSIISIITLILAITLSGCGNPMGETGSEGTLHINFGAGRRAAYDRPPDVTELTHIITLSGSEGTVVIEAKGGSAITATVAVGSWKITAEAYHLNGNLYAEGETTAEVKAGSNKVTLMMKYYVPVFNSIEDLLEYFNSLDPNDDFPNKPYFIALNVTEDELSMFGLMMNDYPVCYNLDLSGSNITSIPKDTFNNSFRLTGITLPDSITSIGDYAFYCCTGLTSITIPKDVVSIGISAFDGCKSLASVNIPNGITRIEDYAFSWCTSLTSINIPDNVTEIGEIAFQYCERLKNVSIGNNVNIIKHGAFSWCTSLTSITIPKSVTGIWGNTFRGCVNLTSVTFEGTISSGGLDPAFPDFDGDLLDKFYETDQNNGTPGTYTRASGSSIWTKSP